MTHPEPRATGALATRSCVGWAARAIRHLRHCESGQDLAELVMITPLLLVVTFGIVEFGSMLDSRQAIAHLTREGANIASRGAPLDTVLAVTMLNGEEIHLSARGGAVASRVLMTDGAPTIEEQISSPGYGSASLVGAEGDDVLEMAGLGLADGASVYVLEVFYDRPDWTPLKNFFSGTLPDVLYDRAVF